MGSDIRSQIISLINQVNPDIAVLAPARVNIISPLDAVEADYWSPAIAIAAHSNPLAAYTLVKKSELKFSKLIQYDFDGKQQLQVVSEVEFQITKDGIDHNRIPQKYEIYLNSMSFIFTKIPEIFEALSEQNIEISVLTTIPIQSGIGGSSSIIISLLWALGYFCKLDKKDPTEFKEFPFNKDVIAEISTEIENNVLQNTAGYGDRYTIARGGIGFASYVGKLNHSPLGNGPLAVYDRIDVTYNITKIPIIIAFSGVQHISGDIHKILRKKYLEEDKYLVQQYEKLGNISWKARYALMRHDWATLGSLVTRNTHIMEEIMLYTEFDFGIGWANKLLLELIKGHPDVYGTKLTGAGGGGSVFAIVNPKNTQGVLEYWHNALNIKLENIEDIASQYPDIPMKTILELKNAQFFVVQIEPHGVHCLDQMENYQ